MLIQSMIETYRQRARYREILEIWQRASVGNHADLVSTWLKQTPRCGAAWFLQGVLHLHEYRTRQAARAFGMAHHCDCNLEAAALLTFACLKASDGQDSDILRHIAKTWEEMKRPTIGYSSDERLILEAIEAPPSPPPTLSPLGRMAWFVVGETQRTILSASTGRADSGFSALFRDPSIHSSSSSSS
jgi:hypothetical protein